MQPEPIELMFMIVNRDAFQKIKTFKEQSESMTGFYAPLSDNIPGLDVTPNAKTSYF